MRVLLDTHALIWALEGSSRLSALARQLIEAEQNEVLVSVVSGWEMAVKSALGKLKVPADLEFAIVAAGFVQRSVRFSDCEQLKRLPALHRDPFDRMLVAQALSDGVPLVTCDEEIARYPLQTIW